MGTIIDHASRPDPGGSDLVGPSSRAPSLLGSISRELAFNDPDADNGEDGTRDRRGDRRDRNVELLVKDRYAGSGRRGHREDDGHDDDDGRDGDGRGGYDRGGYDRRGGGRRDDD